MYLYTPILLMVSYCGVIITRHHYHNWWDYKTKLFELSTMCHFVATLLPIMNLGLIKFPDIVKLYACQLFYDHLINKTSSNRNLSLVSEQHNYATRSASLQHLTPYSFRINIRKFCPTILGCYYWNDIPLFIHNKPTRKLF